MLFIIIIILGLVLGSFVNALVWRLREQDMLRSQSGNRVSKKKKLQDLSIVKGRSMCPQCQHTLSAKDLVPVFSWLALHGKCRYCHKPISWQYPAVELVTATLFAASYLLWPFELDGLGAVRFAIWLVFLVGFVALAVYDLHWFELPDRIVWPLLGLAVVQTLATYIIGRDTITMIYAFLAAGIIGGLFGGIYAISKGAWIGFGDVKLAPILGLLATTPYRVLLIIFLASVIGTFMSIPTLMKGKKWFGAQVPFGPALLAATFVVVLFGSTIIDWYMSLVLFEYV